MPDHIDREKSKAAINKKIAEEEAALKETEDRKKAREADHRDTGDLDKSIAEQKAEIAGKREILRIVDEAGQVDAIDREIAREQSMLDDMKKEIDKLRREEPKPRAKIDALDSDIDLLSRMIKGKGEAKDVLVF